MSNVIKYTTTPVNDTIKKGNFALGINDVDYGPTNITGFYATTIPSTSGYTIYNQSGGTLSYQSVSGTTDLINYLSNKRGINMTTDGEALSWAAGQSSIFVTNREYENIVTSGMVLNLDAGFVSSYPTSATTWYDLSYSGNNGTLVNGPTFSSLSGGSIVFDGVDDSVVCGTGTTTLLSSMTISSTFSFTTFTNGTHMIASRLGDASNTYNHNYFFGIQQSKFYFGFKNATQNTYPLVLLTDFLPVTGVTYNLTATYSTTSSVRIYLNGVEQGYRGLNTVLNPLITNQPVRNDSSTILSLGSGYAENTYYSNCKIYFTQLYNRVLSPFEVYQNYNAMKGRFGIPDIVTSGLTLNMDAGNPYSYNPLNTGSTTWNDVSGYGNNGTLINGTYYSGGTMVFDGTDDYVESANNLGLSGTNPRTYGVWVKIRTYLDNSGIIRTGAQGTANADMSLETTTTPGTFTFNGWVNDFDFTISSNFYGWHYLVITYTGTQGQAYADGVLKNSLTFTSAAPNSKLQLGSDRQAGAVQGNNLDGSIGEAHVYNRLLTAAEVLQNFNATRYKYGI
jgi:hypothetical protein